MRNNIETMITSSYEKFNKERASIRKSNQALIAYWRSIPWWKFWERPSFKEQKEIIIDSWRR